MNTLAQRLNRGTHYQAGKWIVTNPICGKSSLLEIARDNSLHVLHQSLPFDSALKSAYEWHMNYCRDHA
jgi:hypothetical protein